MSAVAVNCAPGSRSVRPRRIATPIPSAVRSPWPGLVGRVGLGRRVTTEFDRRPLRQERLAGTCRRRRRRRRRLLAGRAGLRAPGPAGLAAGLARLGWRERERTRLVLARQLDE